MIAMDIKICILDNAPVEQSRCYQTLVEEVGEARADFWTKIITVPKEEEA